MKSSNKTTACLILFTLFLASRPPLIGRGQNQNNFLSSAATIVQSARTIKWRFGGNDAGSGRYTTNPDGTFESVTELNIVGQSIKSVLTGKLVDGLISEFEMVTQQAGTEVKVSAKDGKAKIILGPNSRNVDYKPAAVLFGNLHPVFTETWAKVLDPTKDGSQTIDVFVLDAAAMVKVDVIKKKARTVDAGGQKQVANVYEARFPTVSSMSILPKARSSLTGTSRRKSCRRWRAGYEAFLVDPSTLYPELSQPVMTTLVGLFGIRRQKAEGRG